jgi:hypothetical protein
MKITTLRITLLTALLFIGSTVFSQMKVIDATDLPEEYKELAVPDVNNKVLISSDIATIIDNFTASKDITIFPGWPVIYNGSSNRGGVWCNLDEDSDQEIVYCIGQKVYAFNIDGTTVDGWPQSLALPSNGAPAFGDVDGDSEGEIVVSVATVGTGSNGKVYVFEKDGTLTYGFPFILNGGATKTPVLADLDGDDVMEIIVEERSYPTGYIGAYYGDGTDFPGFPVEMDYIPASSVAVGDITGDDIPEIVGESYYSVFAVDVNGNILEGFPYTMGNDRVFSYSSPVLADMDGDGIREILVGDHSLSAGNGAVHVLKNDGTLLDGWPRYTAQWIYGPPAVGDIDGDGNPEVAIGDQVLSGTPASRVYVWDSEGNNLSGWPTALIWSINTQVIIADLDGDNEIELMWDDNTADGKYLGYNSDGTVMDGWPLLVEGGSTFFMNPFIADVNNDGITDISGGAVDISGSNDCSLYLWDAGVDFHPDINELSVLQYNVRHDGVYIDKSLLNAAFIGNPFEICEGSEVQFTDLSTGNITSWEWSFPGGEPSSSTEQNPVVTYSSTGQYDVSLIVSDGTNSDEILKPDYIKVAYEPELPAVPDGPTDVTTSNTPFSFYETSSVNATGFIWEMTPDSAGILIMADTINKAKIFWDQSFSGTVELRVKSANVCGESDFSEPLVIAVNLTAISENLNNGFSLFPNPAHNLFTIQCDESVLNLNKKAILYNIFGQLVKEADFQANRKTLIINVTDIPNGIYMLKIESGNKNLGILRVVVE